MKILNPDSLIATVDNVNEAIFLKKDWSAEYDQLAEWISSRLGKDGGYGGSFAMTDKDWSSVFRLYTGEQLTTRAGRSHVLAQETTRILKVIERMAGYTIDACRESEARLTERIFKLEHYDTMKSGEYCCATCSVALWRCLNAGGYSLYSQTYQSGLKALSQYRIASGGWGRFPFYYTILALLESGHAMAKKEILFHIDSSTRRLKGLRGKRDKYSARKRELLKRVLNQ